MLLGRLHHFLPSKFSAIFGACNEDDRPAVIEVALEHRGLALAPSDRNPLSCNGLRGLLSDHLDTLPLRVRAQVVSCEATRKAGQNHCLRSVVPGETADGTACYGSDQLALTEAVREVDACRNYLLLHQRLLDKPSLRSTPAKRGTPLNVRAVLSACGARHCQQSKKRCEKQFFLHGQTPGM